MPGGVFGPRWRESWLEYLPSRKNTKEKERRRRGVSESRNWYICPFLWAFQARHVDNSNADRRRSRLHARRYIKRIVRYEKIKYRLGARNSFVRFISDRTIVSETTDTRRPVPAHHATFFFFPPLVYYINGTRSTFMRREARGIESFFPFFLFLSWICAALREMYLVLFVRRALLFVVFHEKSRSDQCANFSL